MPYKFDDSSVFFKRTFVFPLEKAKNKLKRTFYKHFPWPKTRKGLLKTLKFIINQTEAEDKNLITFQLKRCAELSRLPEDKRDENPAFLRQRISFNIYRSCMNEPYTQPNYPSLMTVDDIFNRRFLGIINGGITSFLNISPKEQNQFLCDISQKKKLVYKPLVHQTIQSKQKD